MNIGFDPRFIGNDIIVEMPRLTPEISATVLQTPDMRDLIFLDYIHYTIVMNKSTRQPIFAASNIDQALFRHTERGDNWRVDSRAGRDNQLNNDYYKKNDWDKGHMVMRNNTAWGATQHEAQTADDESFYYTNAAFQHLNMNRDEWLGLEEEVVRKFAEDTNDKLIVFTGPIHGILDRQYERGWHDSVRIPSGFFKVICYHAKNSPHPKKLGVKSFAMFQDEEIIKDQRGRRSIKYKEYQVTVSELQQMTGLDFGVEIFDTNPLFYYDREERREDFNVGIFPERIPIDNATNIIDFDDVRLNQEHYESRNVAIISAMVNPKGDEKTGEWVTILNRTSKSINLKGWQMLDQKNRKLELNGTIKAGESITYMGKGLGKIKLTNSGGSLRLIDKDPCLIDHVTWTGLDVGRSEGVALLFNG